ncbi:MAG: integrase [Candidimonas sp.]|nr:MAG: integrase [Candidimonas sp.]TAM21037.1 MAG: integrase [Candidimonas sp.]
MFEKLLSCATALRRHQDGPFAAERERYLQHCSDSGATYGSLRIKCNELLWAAELLDVKAKDGIDMEKLESMADRRMAFQNAPTTRPRFMDATRPWLRFLGWWKEPVVAYEFQGKLDQYHRWMRDERGFSDSTIVGWLCRVRDFLIWCNTNGRALPRLRPSDIDDYFIDDGAHHWSRRTVATMAAALRTFLRYGASQGWCDPQLASAIRGPRIYAQESLPFAPGWEDVRRLLAATLTDDPHDIRARAILMLLAIYGLRATEVATLRLDQVDWQQRVIRIFRLKRRQPQVYPLLPSVAQALARYIDIVRPSTPHPEVFISLHSPRRPLTRAAIYKVVSARFLALGIEVAHRGPHALRHACATRLVAEGFTIKEIGDHLGHRSASATRTYAKVNLAALREVGDFDLGDLQ